MDPIFRISLGFLGVALQVIAVEAKKGGGKSKGKGGGGGASIGGATVGVLAGLVILAAMILKYRPHVMRFLGRSNPKTNQPCANKISKPLDLEWNTMGGYMPQDAPAYPTIPPPLQYSQMDWKREPYPVPPQFYPGPPPFPPTPYMGAAYTPSQYSPTSPFPMPYSPPTQYSPAPAYSG